MQIKSIKWKNLLIYGKNWNKFTFKNGIDILYSQNGQGKSCILDALNYAFFGKPYRKIKLSNLINFRNEKELVVEVEFKVNNNDYKIIRGMKPNIFEIYQKVNKKWKLIPQDANTKDYQNKLEDIFGFNEYIFRQVIVLGAGINKNFIEMSSKEKEEFFETLTSTYIINLLTKLAKDKYKVKLTELKNIEYKMNLLKETIQSLENQKQKVEEQKKQNKEQIEKRKNELQEQLQKLEQAKDKLQNELQNIDNSDMLKLEQELIQLQEQQKKLNEAKTKIEVHINAFNNKEVQCPKCGERFVPESENLEDLKKKHLVVLDKIDEILLQYKEKYDSYLELKNEYDNQVNEINNKIFKIQSKIIAIRSELNSFDYHNTEIEFDYKLLKEKQKELKEIEIEYQNIYNETEKLERLVKIFSSGKIKEQILMTILPVLNKYINMYLEKFNAGFQFFIENNLKEKVIKQGTELEFNNLSNGQKQRVLISLLFGFLKLMEDNGYKVNILVLDEFLDNALDEEGLEIVLNILNEYKSKKDVIIISHNIALSSKIEFDRKFTIEQKLGFSNLIEVEK